MAKFMLSCFAAAIFSCVSASAQNFKQEINLSGLGIAGADCKPFGIAFNPTNNLLYVAVSGSFGSNNNVVAVIDPVTDSVMTSIPVGLYPEDIAFSAISGNGAVTNSTSGSVTFFDNSNNVTSTLQLPDPFGIGSCYPFGITYSAGYYYVGTVDGSGEVYVIDAVTEQLMPGKTISTGYKSIGRMVESQTGLLISTTAYNATWSGSTAGVYGYQSNASSSRHTNYFSADNIGSFPSASDITIGSTGKIFMTGIDFDGKLYVINNDGTPARVIDAHGHNGYGLATSQDQSVVALCELATGSIVLFDAHNEEYYSQISFIGMANDAVFAAGKLYVTDQSNERVMVYDQIPTFVDRGEHSGDLDISNSAPTAGDTVSVSLHGINGNAVWLVGATSYGVTTHNGVSFDIGPSVFLYGTGASSYQMTRTVPNNPVLVGRHFYFQGAFSDGFALNTTEPAVLIIQ
ncbi:MAG: hypothetical protein H8E25_17685 [Planctomycetes bacterium]|nr:hypothetical protein [Planctomycetota bacterium]